MPKNMSKALATSVMEEKTKGGKEGGRERERGVKTVLGSGKWYYLLTY